MYNERMTLLKQLNIRIAPELYAGLKVVADDTQSSISRIARLALARGLDPLVGVGSPAQSDSLEATTHESDDSA